MAQATLGKASQMSLGGDPLAKLYGAIQVQVTAIILQIIWIKFFVLFIYRCMMNSVVSPFFFNSDNNCTNLASI